MEVEHFWPNVIVMWKNHQIELWRLRVESGQGKVVLNVGIPSSNGLVVALWTSQSWRMVQSSGVWADETFMLYP